jgi:hypothetical protein
MVSSSATATASADRTRSAAAAFSRRWATEEVPGIRTVVAEPCSSQARATCCGEASRRAARLVSVPDWSGVKPPKGKNEATSRDGAHRQEVGLVGFEGHLTRYRAAISSFVIPEETV